MSLRMGDEFLTDQGRRNARLRVIFDNGTEIGVLLRSFQRALYKDEAGRRITDPDGWASVRAGRSCPMAMDSGTIYVLRSKSDHPQVAPNREVLHKIGVTGQDVIRASPTPRSTPTFLLADVEIVATYELQNINRTKLENLLHSFFSAARLDLEIKDRFGIP